MSEVKLTMVGLDDWEAFYIDGKKMAEGHRVPLREIFEAMEKAGLMDTIVFEELDVSGSDWEENVAHAGYGVPDKLWDIPKGAFR